MIKVQSLSKSFGGREVLSDISFDLHEGEVLGFLGPNGAGKTTTMRILSGYTLPTHGKVLFNEQDIQEHSVEIRQHIGYLPESNPLYENMRVFEYLEFAARMKVVTNFREEIQRVVKATQLQDKITSNISELSKGYRQRVGLADALLGNPDVLILDEPTSGLDPNQAAEIRKLIRSIGHKKTVIFSTHILNEVQAICDRVLIINHGKIVGKGTVDELIHQSKGKTEVMLKIEGPQEVVVANLKQLGGVESVEIQGDEDYKLISTSTHDICRDVYQSCVKHHWTLLRMNTSEVSLEEVFRQLTQ